MINLVVVCKNKLIKYYTMDAILRPIVDDLKKLVSLATCTLYNVIQMWII